MITAAAFHEARARIAPYIRHTPLLPKPSLRNDWHTNLTLKLENLQVTGSFKVRGAFNNLLQLNPTQRQRGVCSASGGNHGVALAYAAWRLGCPATIYLPERATADREARIAAWGAKVIRHGAVWDDAHEAALAYAAAHDIPYVHSFEAETTIVGQGTLGLEMLEDAPNADLFLVAIGGGGLISGVATAIKQQRPHATIIGIEPVGAPSMQHSITAGVLTPLTTVSTFADTLSPRMVSQTTLDLARANVDRIVLVNDTQMLTAMRWLWQEANQLVEPSGAASIAAIQAGLVDLSNYTQPVALICGGNAGAEPVFQAYQHATKD
ncbi:MAG: threonine ammonia-lyase [Roseiflexaceae bacterium]